VVQTFRTIAAVLEQQCREAVDTYIVSAATEPAHLLEVLLLAREARLFRATTPARTNSSRRKAKASRRLTRGTRHAAPR
jgi:phosphoenolpyruvate carboxylase